MVKPIVMAQLKHETNTFSPIPTPLERFVRHPHREPYRGDDAREAFRDTGTALGAFIDLCEERGDDVHVALAAHGWPSGIVDDAAFDWMTGVILDAVRKGCSAILLDLHGAMVTQSHSDGEYELLRRIREVASDVPVGVALDMHANISHEYVALCTSIAGYRTYPHVDNYSTGIRAAQPILAMLDGEPAPIMKFVQVPMLPHIMRQHTEVSPHREIQDCAREMEQEAEVWSASFFPGFPHADVHDAGSSAICVTRDAPSLAEQHVRTLLDMAWTAREAFIYHPRPVADSIEQASQCREGPVILLDHYDNAASGGTMDTMTVLGAILDSGLENVAAFAIHDPKAVQDMIEAGIGSTVTVELGGKIDMPSMGLKGEPREVTGTVRVISNGVFRNEGPASKGVLMDMGHTVVLDTGKVEIVVISRHQEPNDLGCLKHVGIDPLTKKYIMLKSRVHFRAGFGPIATRIIDFCGTGVCTSDYSQMKFRNVRRPIYPLDSNEFD